MAKKKQPPFSLLSNQGAHILHPQLLEKFAVFVGRQPLRKTIRWHGCSIYPDYRDGVIDSRVRLA